MNRFAARKPLRVARVNRSVVSTRATLKPSAKFSPVHRKPPHGPLKSLEQLNKRGELGWVIEDESKVVGFLVVRAVVAEAEILNLCIAPTKRRKGLAEALLNEALAELRRTRVDRLFLEVRESNTPAISFYEKHGFRKTGRRPGYYRNPDEAAVLMMKELTG